MKKKDARHVAWRAHIADLLDAFIDAQQPMPAKPEIKHVPKLTLIRGGLDAAKDQP